MGKTPGLRSARNSVVEEDLLEDFRTDVEDLIEALVEDPDAKRAFLVDVFASGLRDEDIGKEDPTRTARTRAIVKQVVKELRELDDAAIAEAARAVVQEHDFQAEAIRYLKSSEARTEIRDEIRTEIRKLIRDATTAAVDRVRGEWIRLVTDHVAAGLTKRDLTKVFNEYFRSARARSRFGVWR